MGFSECARTRGCNMFPHYMLVAGWLALAAVVLAWVSMAAYLTVSITSQSDAPRSERVRWIVRLWLLPVVGVAAYLMVAARSRNESV